MNCDDISELSPLYLAGKCDERQSGEVAAHLESCAECARIFDQDARLRDAVLAEHIDSTRVDGVVRGEIRRAVIRRRLWTLGGVAATLAIALFAYRSFTAVNPVFADAAEDHRDEVVNRQHRTWISDTGAITALAGRRGIEGVPVEALAPAGYRLEHARLCRLDGRVVLHLVYTDGSHEVSIFLGQPDMNRAALRSARIGDESIAGFASSKVAAIVVTEQSREETLAIARHASSVL